jgi:diacylglycerol kinase (ATP)
MKNNKAFSIRERAGSFRYAANGIINFFQAEHNAVLHVLGTLIAIILAITLHVSRMETIVLVFAIGFVWVAELFNTVIEKIMDFISVESHPKIGFIKDLSAGAVLVAAVVAFIAGCIVFIPKF